MAVHTALEALRGKLVVSCQASEGDAFFGGDSMVRFARAAREGGAVAIRANGPEDVRAIREGAGLPVIGIAKSVWSDGRILITGRFEDAQALVAAGAAMVALDVTVRGQRYGALDRLRRIKHELGVPVLADVATVEEGIAAADAGADAVLSTMRGYTDDTAHLKRFDAEFIGALCEAVRIPVIAEGRIATPEDAAAAMRQGAWAVIVGTAITRPTAITRGFAEAVARTGNGVGDVLGIDLGGTHTKFGAVDGAGRFGCEGFVPTPAGEGRTALLGHLRGVALRLREEAERAGMQPRALGIGTAGWVDPRAGEVVYATGTMPGWTGAAIARELEAATGLPTAVENDANALAVAEKHFGAAKEASDFACITLGTGVGGGMYAGGRLIHGAHFVANAIGHLPVVLDGLPCVCGLRGCLEAYANAAALLRYAGDGYADARAVIAAANGGDERAEAAIREYAHYLAAGAAMVVQMLDPELLVFAGGVAQENPLLLEALRAELEARVSVARLRKLRIAVSSLGYYAGVYGAVAVARERLADAPHR